MWLVGVILFPFTDSQTKQLHVKLVKIPQFNYKDGALAPKRNFQLIKKKKPSNIIFAAYFFPKLDKSQSHLGQRNRN